MIAVPRWCAIMRLSGHVESLPSHRVSCNAACLCTDTERVVPRTAHRLRDAERLELVE
jgi:hypothetical protein